MNKKFVSSIIILIVVISGAAAFSIERNRQPQTSTEIPAQNYRTFSLKSDSQGKTYAVNAPSEYSFSIVDEHGNTLKDFAITHTKIMHVIVARKDLAYFQHLHPDYDASNGTFILKDLTFPADGEYRIFADFAPDGTHMGSMGMPLTTTLSEDVSAGNLANWKPQDIGTEEKAKVFDGLQVALNTHSTPISVAESMLTFSLAQSGKPVTDLESYLGALGHAVVLREGNLDFIHAHPSEDVSTPQTGNVDFMVDFPEPGKYKIFTQFQRAGKVITTDFVVSVAPGSSSDSMPVMNMSMPGMDHSKIKMRQ